MKIEMKLSGGKRRLRGAEKIRGILGICPIYSIYMYENGFT